MLCASDGGNLTRTNHRRKLESKEHLPQEESGCNEEIGWKKKNQHSSFIGITDEKDK